MIKLLTQHLFLFMFMGLSARMLGVRRVLFVGLRDGDVTVWYQSSRLQQWASMGQESAVTSAKLLPSQQKSNWKFQENRLSVRQSEELTKFTSAVAEGLVERTSAVAEARSMESSKGKLWEFF